MKIVSIIVGVVLVLFGFAGGGGSDSGGGGGGGGGGSDYSSSDGSGDGDFASFLIAIAICAVAVAAEEVQSKRRSKKEKREAKRLQDINNSTPQEKWIHETATNIFKAYQADWSNFQLENISTYTTPRYFEHAKLMLELLQSLSRVNEVSDLKVHVVGLQSPVNDTTELPAKIGVVFVFSGTDKVIDTKTNKRLYVFNAKWISETWNFIYDGKTLKLDGISQPTESSAHLIKSLAEFANQRDLYYSPDWGRYALPDQGLLFSGASLYHADVNNHIVGKWQDLLFQMYTYAGVPGVSSGYFLVGQITLPKSYHGVIVLSKKQQKTVNTRISKKYRHFEMEWPDFNKRYAVYASDADALPAFELLNPKFMEFLYSKNPNLSLEVVGDSVYIFANVKGVTAQDYATMLDVLNEAFKELKI